MMKSAMKMSMKMKSMMSMKMVMKKAMKKAMKKSIYKYKPSYAKYLVFKGKFAKTASGLKKSSLMKSKSGKIVSSKKSALGKKAYKKISKWTAACTKAKKALGYKGFVPVGGKSAKGIALYKKALGYKGFVPVGGKSAK